MLWQRVCVSLMWWVVVPLKVVWTGMGARYTWQLVTEAPDCMPSNLHLAFVISWHSMCCLWLFFYCRLGVMALLLEHRLRRTERTLRDITDGDMERRWGDVGTQQGYTA